MTHHGDFVSKILIMEFLKFTILDAKYGNGSRDTSETEMLINTAHIVSIKPIRISTPERLINGFWIRTTNGKKYKATEIPASLLGIIGEKYSAPVNINFDTDDQPFQ